MAQSFQFASPSDYSDWAKYAGFDRTTGEQQSFSNDGVAPPNGLSGLEEKMIAPIQSKINTASNIASNLNSGNISGAVQAFKNPTTPLQQPTQQSNKFNYTVDMEEE
jgi:hypothetical protein